VHLLTAHLDDMPSGPVAPGADDNASGVTAVMLAAQLLRPYDFDCTLRFVLFTGEEQGLIGSSAYAADLAAAGEDVRSVLNLDMIAYNSDADPTINLHVRSALTRSLAIAQAFSQVIRAYGLDLIPEVEVDHWLGNFSDNKSFWDQGYPAILAIEDWAGEDSSPYYHTVSDTLATLDLGYFAAFAQAAIGTHAHLSCPSQGVVRGSVTATDTGLPVPSTVTAIAGSSTYTALTDLDGVFTMTLPAYTFTFQIKPHLPIYQPRVFPDLYVTISPTQASPFVLEPWPGQIFVPVAVKGMAD
jgi:hypothetical protein